jgi:TonB-dependent SusC/RagA subfamily outer membrane receptor
LIIVIFILSPSAGQNANKKIKITGVVLDANQTPVEGAIVFIDNKKTNSLTDSRGFYKVKVSQKAKMITVFTFKNGASEVAIDGRITINFALTGTGISQKTENNKTQNDETINVGYGSVKKKELTTSVGKINGHNHKFASYQNIYEMIRGEVPGVQVYGKSIMIQGPSSINLSTEPLFVVNGIPVTSIDEISPQMVKSIEILKGASASIYGSRGSNGVIIITLINGSEKEKEK